MKLIKTQELAPDTIMRIATGVIFSLVITSGVLLYFWEVDSIHYLPRVSLCPFHFITGIPCPGCGMTRAFLTLGQLKMKEAIALNPFSIPLLSVMIFYLWLGYIPRFLQQKAVLRFSIPTVVTLWIFYLLTS